MRSAVRRTHGLDPRIRQGYYGEAFVRALAASAGLVVSRPDLDVSGEDFIIGMPGLRGSVRNPRIEVQVKSWCNPSGSATTWRYRMRAAHFNELAGGRFYLPRYLFLVVVPQDADEYAVAADDALRLHHAGYWASFADRELVAGASTITVDVPRRNLLTAAALRGLMPAELAVPGPRRSS
jgi:hypothetical protein